MNVLYVGSVINNKDSNKKLGPSIAGNKMQLGIIRGLKKNLNSKIDIISQEPIAVYPKEKKIIIKKRISEIYEDLYANMVPFINIYIIKQITKMLSTFILIKRWKKSKKQQKKIIICYNTYPEISLPVLLSADKATQIICIFADPPIDPTNRRGIFKLIKKVEETIAKKVIKKFDGLVVLNEQMIYEYAPNANYVLVDGGFDVIDTPDSLCGGQWKNIKPKEKFKVVFSGALTEYNGIINLIEAVKLIKNKQFLLEIYGSGPLEDYVKKKSELESKVKYMGMVKNDEMMKIQREAALLVNPRIVKNKISELSFPSKMIEYLLSGTPVVSTKLNGFTEDYLDQMIVFDDDTPECMAKKIDEVLLIEPEILISKATNAREFIKKNKNWDKQTKKIEKLIHSLT